MDVGKICWKETIAVGPRDPISRVVQAMRENHVGAVVVHEDGRPVGIVTDRDIILRGAARREVLADVPVHEVMTKNVVTASPDDDILEVLGLMREHGIRRVPVVNDAGLLAGIVSLDDILLHLARSMKHMADVVLSEMSHET